MAEQAYAYVTLIPVAKGFQSAVAKQLSGVGGEGGTAGKTAGNNFKSQFGGALKGLAAIAGTAIAAAGVGRFFSDSIKQASDLNESLNAVNVSYGANAKGIAELGKAAATQLGLSTQEFNQLAVGFTAFGEKIAGPGGDVVGIIDDLTTRGSDFASVMNLEVNEALTLFRSGLSGETEPLRRFGIDVSEAQVKMFAYANGIAESGAQLTEAQKVQARYGTIMEQTSRMQGDFANTSDQLANATRIVQAQFKDLQAEIGAALLPALQQLMPTLIPIVQQAAPLLIRIFEALIPVITALTDNMQPLFDALSPIIDAFALVAEVAGEIIAQALPPFIELLSILTPIIQNVVEALMPIVLALLPPLINLIEAILPFIERFAGYLNDFLLPALTVVADVIAGGLVWAIDLLANWLTWLFDVLSPIIDVIQGGLTIAFNWLVGTVQNSLIPALSSLWEWLSEYITPVLEWLGGLIGDTVAWAVDKLSAAFEWLKEKLRPVYEALKPILEGLLSLSGLTPAELTKEINVTTRYNTVGTPPPDVEVWDILSQRGATPTTVTPTLPSMPSMPRGGTGPTAAEIRDQVKGYIKDTKKALKDARKDYNDAIAEANKDYAIAQADIAEAYDNAIVEATKRRDEAMANALQRYNENVAQINADSAEALADIIQQSMDRLRDAFRTVAEVNIADMFSSDAVNKNITGLIDGLREKLTASRRLMENAAALASQGFSQTFIEQVVAAGTETGNQLAEGILNATPDQQRELQDLFGIIETEAAHGMDSLAETLYEKNGLATEELTQMYEQVLVDQTAALAEQKELYDQTISDIMVAFNQEIADAAAARDEALAEAEVELNDALLKANENFLESLNKIEEDFTKKIDGMKGQVSSFSRQIDSLTNKISNFQNDTALNIRGLDALTPFADGGLVTGPTPALVGEAGPELIIPLNKFQSMAEAAGGGKSLNYYAAPNQSVDSEQALFQAMRRAKVVANW